MSSYTVEAVLKATGADQFASAFQKASGAAERMKQIGGKMKSVGKGMTAGITLPVVGMGAAIIKTGAQFDDQMQTVKAVTGATSQEFNSLRETARDMGRNTRYSASEAAEGMEHLARAGFDTNKTIEALPSVLDMAAANNMDLGDSAKITANLMAGFSSQGITAAEVADVLSYASAESQVDVGKLGEAMKYAAPMADMLGISFEDTTAAIGLLGDEAIESGQAGRMLRSGLQSLATPTDGAAKLMKKFGIEVFDANDELKPMPEVIKQLENGLGDMSDKQRAAALETMFGSDAMSAWSILIDQGGDKLGEFSKSLEESEGTAAEMHEVMEDSLAGSFRSMRSALEDLSIAFYDIGEGPFRNFIDNITELVKKFIELDDGMKQTIIIVAGIAAAIGPVLIVLGMLLESVSTVGAALKTISPIFGGISLSMFAWIAVIALVVVAIVELWRTNEDFRNNIMSIWTSIMQIITAVFEAIQPAISVFIGSLMLIVQALMPVIAWVVNAAAVFLAWIAHVIETYSWITTLITVLTVIVGAIAGVIAIVAVLTQIFTVIATVISVVVTVVKVLGAIFLFLTSPIGVVIAVIGLLVAAVIWLGDKFEWLGNLLDGVANFMSNAWNSFLGFFGGGTKEAADEASESIEGVSEKGKEDLDSLATEGTASAEELNAGVTDNVAEMTAESGGLMAELEASGKIDMESLNMGATDESSDMSGNVTGNIADMTGESSDLLADLESSGNIDMSSLNTGVSGEVADMSKDVQSQVGAMESSASGDFSGLSNDMSKNAENVKSNVTKSFKGMSKSIESEMKNIKNIASSSLKGIANDFQSGMNAVNKTVLSSTKALTNTMKSSMLAMSNEVKSGFLRVTHETTQGTTKMNQDISRSITLIVKSYQSGFLSVNSAITSGMNRSLNTVRSRNNSIVSNTRGLHGQLYNAGLHAMSGLQRGLNARSGGVLATARNIANRVASTMRSALQVRSPSRVMMKIGGFVGEGLVVGMENMARMVDRASEMLGLAAIPELEPINVGGQVRAVHSQANRQLQSHMTSEFNVSRQPIEINIYDNKESVRAYVNEENAINATIRRF